MTIWEGREAYDTVSSLSYSFSPSLSLRQSSELSLQSYVGGIGRQIQLLTRCIIITANGPLKENYHQYDIIRQRVNE